MLLVGCALGGIAVAECYRCIGIHNHNAEPKYLMCFFRRCNRTGCCGLLELIICPILFLIGVALFLVHFTVFIAFVSVIAVIIFALAIVPTYIIFTFVMLRKVCCVWNQALCCCFGCCRKKRKPKVYNAEKEVDRTFDGPDESESVTGTKQEHVPALIDRIEDQI